MATNPINKTNQLNNNVNTTRTKTDIDKTSKKLISDITESKDTQVSQDTKIQNKDYTVKLSDKAQQMSEAYKKALTIAKNTPDLEREEKIQEIKKKIEEGNYKIDTDKIAEEIVREFLKDEVALRLHQEAKNRPKLR